MPKPDPGEVRSRLETARRDLARAEAELASYQRERETAVSRLRELLGCEPGKERSRLEELQKTIEEDETELARLLSEAEAANTEVAQPT